MNTFEELSVWKLSREMRIEISNMIKSFPKIEQFRLSDQMIRASRSIAANIAEGYGRFHHQENIQFCRHARGSLLELLEHLIVSKDEGYISEDQFSLYKEKVLLINKVLNGYISYLKNAKEISQNNSIHSKEINLDPK
jgi:four helix bundle protein